MGKLKIKKHKRVRRSNGLVPPGELLKKLTGHKENIYRLASHVTPRYTEDEVRSADRLADAMFDELLENGASGRDIVLVVSYLYDKMLSHHIAQVESVVEASKRKTSAELAAEPEPPAPEEPRIETHRCMSCDARLTDQEVYHALAGSASKDSSHINADSEHCGPVVESQTRKGGDSNE